MADKFTPPQMDWTSSEDVYKRFKLFRQKCEFIFEGPLEGVDEKKQVRHLLLWVGDTGLEIFNTATFDSEDDRDKTKQVLDKLESYTKPQSNQILTRYQLRCLKQGESTLEEFVTKARVLVDDSGYLSAVVKEDALRDTLVFGLRSDMVRRDAIAKGNGLTFQQVYELAKVDESTRAQMKAITQNEDKTELHAVRSKKQSTFVKKSQGPESFKTTGATNEKSSNQMDASDVEANMTNPWSAQLSLPHASIVVSRVITSKCVSRRIKRFISWKLKVLLMIAQKPSMFSWEL